MLICNSDVVSNSRRQVFLAGDTAQTILEGADFQFSDLRSALHFIYDGRADASSSKPKHLDHNYRSHTGILDVAANLVRRMHVYSDFDIPNMQLVYGAGLGGFYLSLSHKDFSCWPCWVAIPIACRTCTMTSTSVWNISHGFLKLHAIPRAPCHVNFSRLSQPCACHRTRAV